MSASTVYQKKNKFYLVVPSVQNAKKKLSGL